MISKKQIFLIIGIIFGIIILYFILYIVLSFTVAPHLFGNEFNKPIYTYCTVDSDCSVLSCNSCYNQKAKNRVNFYLFFMMEPTFKCGLPSESYCKCESNKCITHSDYIDEMICKNLNNGEWKPSDTPGKYICLNKTQE